MGRLAGLVIAVLLAFAFALAPPALASKASRWERVLRDHDIQRTSHKITVRGLRVGTATVSVRVHARATNAEPVVFPDPMFGATAWRWDGRRWSRIDSAEVRPAVVQELEPGHSARVRLPLKRRPGRIRVLLPVTADRSGRWVDVVR